MVKKQRNIIEKVLIFVFISFPYLFLRVSNVNIALFDVLLIVLLVGALLAGKGVRNKPVSFYVTSWVFIVVSFIPVFIYGFHTEHFTGVLQYIFILFLMFPLINSVLEFDLYIKAFRITCITWSFFLLLNLFFIYDLRMYEANGRFVSFFSKPLGFGLMTAIFFPFLLEFFSRSKGFILKVLYLLSSILSIFFILATGSRASLLGLSLGILFFFLMKYGKRKSIVGLAILIIGVWYIDYNYNYLNRVNSFEDRDAISRMISGEGFDQRIENFKKGLPQNSTEFFAGVGLNNSAETLRRQGGGFRTHNFFISMLKETGVVGLLSMIGILVTCFARGIFRLLRNFIRGRGNNGIVTATFSSGIILLVAQQVSTVPTHRAYWLIYALCLWLSYEEWNKKYE